MNLSKATTQELHLELQKRTEQEIEDHKPKLNDPPYLTSLKQLCVRYIDAIAHDEEDFNDLEEPILLRALEAFYGNAIWKWVAVNTEYKE